MAEYEKENEAALRCKATIADIYQKHGEEAIKKLYEAYLLLGLYKQVFSLICAN